jgi:hypothetical protein
MTAGQPKLERADLVVTIHWPPLNRRRDRLNLAPTIKACVDGFVDAGVLPDDDDTRIRSETLITAEDRCAAAYAAVLDFDFQPAVDVEKMQADIRQLNAGRRRLRGDPA